MWTTIQVDHEKYESMKRELEILKLFENDKFIRFIEFVDRLSDTRAKVNIKYWINTFIQFDLERQWELESKLNEIW